MQGCQSEARSKQAIEQAELGNAKRRKTIDELEAWPVGQFSWASETRCSGAGAGGNKWQNQSLPGHHVIRRECLPPVRPYRRG